MMPICRDGLSLSSSLLIWPPSLFNNDDLTSYGECVALPSLSSLKLNTVDCPLSCSAQMLFLLSYQIRTRQHPRTSSVASFLSLRLDGCVLFDDLNFKIRAFFGNFLIFKFKFEIFFISFERKKKNNKILKSQGVQLFLFFDCWNWYVTAPDVWCVYCIVNYYTKNRRTKNIATSTSRHSPRRLQASARLLADYVKLVPHSLCPSSLRQTWSSRAADILGIDLDRRSCVNEI